MRPHKNLYLKQIQSLSLPLSCLKGIGPKRTAQFNRKGIHTILDLLFFTPLRYQDRTTILPIKECREGVHSLVQGRVVMGGEEQLSLGTTRVFKILVRDISGGLELLWFHYRKPHLMRYISPGTELFAYGSVRMNRGRPQIIQPEVWTRDDKNIDLAFYPVYSSLYGVSPTLLRAAIKTALEEYLERISDPLPSNITEGLGLPRLTEALNYVHFPPLESSLADLNQRRTLYHRRLLFDRIFLVMLAIASRRKSAQKQKGLTWTCPLKLTEDLSRFFPFTLTLDQEKAFRDIIHDLASGKPMNRLLLGDVGCGKTAVAALAAYAGITNNALIAVMAPTQVLAGQHVNYFSSLPKEMGFRPLLLTGALKKAQKQGVYDKIRSGSCNLVIGTQSLIQHDLRLPGLGLVVIDEQQRFGVRERALIDRKGKNPHQLVMTATPIPRTLAMTLYGDLDISIINGYPEGRKKVVTRMVRETEKRKVLDFLRTRLAMGQQAFVICPVIEESEDRDLKSALETAVKLKKILSPLFAVGLMHGRMPASEKDAVMNDFRRGKIHVLVGTTVVEVGVHVPAATVMIIEHPERFGLAQLHQLRGRVGRGSERGVCLLIIPKDLSEKSLSRLRIMTETQNGFEIAQKDLEERGHGEFIGMRQAGLGDLDLSEMIKEHDLVLRAKEMADALLDSDPELADPSHLDLKNFVESILTKPIDL
ncbi:MAG: ATP-dependent DNA helicase RecG [Deltaproteobacteria bacterium]|nr:ATP-dependent DNA helicase RecG [Deltaproteobacteria bacterium]